jgi:hypothetical protein
MRQFFMTIPFEYDEAAQIDGASSWWIFWRVIVPLAKPALATAVIFAFLAHWNDFWGPLIFLNNTNHFTLPHRPTLVPDRAGGSRPAERQPAARRRDRRHAAHHRAVRQRAEVLRPRHCHDGDRGGAGPDVVPGPEATGIERLPIESAVAQAAREYTAQPLRPSTIR